MYQITMDLELNGKDCLYEQIYEYIKNEMKEGKLLEGEKLPSTRSLAEYLQVARSTVDYAYSQLLDEGYIEAKPKRGFFVCKLEKSFENTAKLPLQEVELERTEKEEEEPYQYDFSPNAISMEYFPFSVWKKINKNIMIESNADLFSHGEQQGDYALRDTISKYLHSSRGVNCSPEQIVVGAGNDYLLLLLEKIFHKSRTVAMENPTYKRAYRIFTSFGWNIQLVDSKQDGMDVDQVSAGEADIAYVMPSHQFPTGAVMSATKRSKLLAWASEQRDRYIIEDDYDSEFRYKGKPIPALQGADVNGRVIYIGTFSKAIAPAIRVSYMVLPLELLKQYREHCGFYSCTVSRIDQRILNEFIRDGYFERYLNKMRKVYREKHQLVLEALNGLKGKYLISGDHAGLHFVVTAKGNTSEEELLERAKLAGIHLYGMSENYIEKKEKKSSVLVGYGGLKDSELLDATKRLVEVLS